MITVGQKIVKRRGRAVLVGGGLGRAEIVDLFGGHEWGRAAPLVILGQSAHLARLVDAGKAEVGELDHVAAPFLRHQHVGRLDVAVDETLGVGVIQGPEQLADQIHRAGDRQGAAMLRQQLRRVGPRHIVHREIEESVGLAHLVERHDIRVIELAQDLRLAEEAVDVRPAWGRRPV